jgi:GST-like protein
MIKLYTDQSPHAWKVSVCLEELELPYELHHLRIALGEQKKPEYLAISPAGIIPAIVDTDVASGVGSDSGDPGLVVIESGAILIYLAEKTGRLLPTEPAARSRVIQWLMFHTANIGPSQGSADVLDYEVDFEVPKAIEYFLGRTRGFYAVLDAELEKHEYIAGDDFSIADIANWTYVGTHEWVGLTLDAYPNLERWLSTMAKRPACCRGLNVPVKLDPESMPEGFEKYRRYIEVVRSMTER